MLKSPPPPPPSPPTEESWEGLGFGNRRRWFPAGLSRFLQTRGCGKQKSLQRPPTIRFTDSVLRTGFLIIILRFGGGGGGGGCGGGCGDFNISPNSKIWPFFVSRYILYCQLCMYLSTTPFYQGIRRRTCSTGSTQNMHSNVCDVGYSSCAEKCRRHTHWCRAGAEDALIGPVQN